MSSHAIVWIAAFLVFGLLSLRRSSFAIPMYIMTFYASPNLWWWGGALKSMGSRWSLVAAIVFVIAVLIDTRPKPRYDTKPVKLILLLLLGYSINALVVHALSAVNPEGSWEWVDLLWKQYGLLIIMIASIRDELDFKILVYSIVFGGAFIGVEVVLFDAGHMKKGRLEGIKLPAGSEANHLAALLVMSVVLSGFLTLYGSIKERVAAFVATAFLVETVLRCISRGVTLAAIAGIMWLVIGAKGRTKTYAIMASVLAIGGALLVMGPEHQEKFFSRLETIFVEEEELDSSAAGRLEFWKSGRAMIADHPFGYGGNAFKTEWARSRYLPDSDVPRSLESGFLDTAVNWGVQGFVLYFGAFLVSANMLRRAKRVAYSRGDFKSAFLATCIQTMFVSHFVAACFNSIMKSEMCFWLLALTVGFEKVYISAESENQTTSVLLENNVR